MPRPARDMTARLDRAKSMISRGLSLELGEQLARFGYTPERLRQGLALHERAMALRIEQQHWKAQARQAKTRLSEAFALAKTNYMQLVRIARIALDGNVEAQQALEIVGPRRRDMASWLRQARTFYGNALGDQRLLDLLAPFISRSMLEQGQAQLFELERADAEQARGRSEATRALRERDEALAQVDGWMSMYIAVARAAFQHEPHKLQMLGI